MGHRQFEPTAGKGNRLVPDGTDPIFGLPRVYPLDGGPSVQNVMPGKADQILRVGRSGSTLRRGTEDDSKAAGAERAELGSWCERQIDLEQLAEQEGAIDRSAGTKIEMVYRAKLGVNEGTPVAERRFDLSTDRYAEEEIDIARPYP